MHLHFAPALSWMGGNPHMEMTARQLRETVEMAFNRFTLSHSVQKLGENFEGSLKPNFPPDWIQTRMGSSQERSLWQAAFRWFLIILIPIIILRITVTSVCFVGTYSVHWQCRALIGKCTTYPTISLPPASLPLKREEIVNDKRKGTLFPKLSPH